MFIPKKGAYVWISCRIANTGKDEFNSTIRNDILIV